MTYLAAGCAAKTPGADCETRCSEYTAYDRGSYQTALHVWLLLAEGATLRHIEKGLNMRLSSTRGMRRVISFSSQVLSDPQRVPEKFQIARELIVTC